MWFSSAPHRLVVRWLNFSHRSGCPLRQPPSWCSTRTPHCRFPARSPSTPNAPSTGIDTRPPTLLRLTISAVASRCLRRSSESWARAVSCASSRPTGATCARPTAPGCRRRRRGLQFAAPTPPPLTISTSTSRWRWKTSSSAPLLCRGRESFCSGRQTRSSVCFSHPTNWFHSSPVPNDLSYTVYYILGSQFFVFVPLVEIFPMSLVHRALTDQKLCELKVFYYSVSYRLKNWYHSFFQSSLSDYSKEIRRIPKISECHQPKIVINIWAVKS